MFKRRQIAGGFGFGLLLGWFTGCGLGLAWSHGQAGERYQPAKELSRLQSPNGKLEAVISYRDAGMLSGDYAHVSIVRKGTSAIAAEKEPAILVVYGGHLEASWRDDHHLSVNPGKGDFSGLISCPRARCQQASLSVDGGAVVHRRYVRCRADEC